MNSLKAIAFFLHYYTREIFLIILATSIFSLILAEATSVTLKETWPLIFFFESFCFFIYFNYINGDNPFNLWSIYAPIYIAMILNVYTDINSVLLVSCAALMTISINYVKLR